MFTDKDFAKMKIPPLSKGDDYNSIFKDIPFIIEFGKGKQNKNNIMTYVVLMFDPESPFAKNYNNPKKRSAQVLDYTGLKKSKKETIEMLTEYKDGDFLKVIDVYVKWLNNRLWGNIVVNETVYYEYQSQLMIPATGSKSKDTLDALKVKSAILENMDTISKRLDGYYDELYANNKELMSALSGQKISPEGIASGIIYA